MKDDIILIIMILAMALAVVVVSKMNVRIVNIERQLSRIENEYHVVIAENEQLQRINNQNFRLLSEQGGQGW